MSIEKPTLRPPWSSAVPANMADPGGVAPNGIPPEGKSIPRRWLNWILNQIDSGVRFIMARGISDYEATETYRSGDKVQYGGTTYTCISGTDITGVLPTVTESWQRWGYTAAEFANAFASALTAAFPTLLADQHPDVFDARLALRTATPSSGDIVAGVGVVSSRMMLEVPYVGGAGNGIKFIKCRITDCGTPAGWFSVTLSGAAAMNGTISAFVNGSTDISHNVVPTVVQPTSNVIEIHFGGTGYVDGPHPTIDLLMIGWPPTT